MAHRSSFDGIQVEHSTPLTETRPKPEEGLEEFDETLPVEVNDPGGLAAGLADRRHTNGKRAGRGDSKARERVPITTGAAFHCGGLAAVALVEGIVIATMYIRQPPAGTTDLGTEQPPRQ